MTRPVEGCQAETPRYGIRTKLREDTNSIPQLGRDKAYYETTGYHWRKFRSIVVRYIVACYDTTIWALQNMENWICKDNSFAIMYLVLHSSLKIL
jgi:hypothetical protein